MKGIHGNRKKIGNVFRTNETTHDFMFPTISSRLGRQGRSAGTQRNGDHLSQQQQQAAVPGGCKQGETHRLHPASAAPQLATPP